MTVNSISKDEKGKVVGKCTGCKKGDVLEETETSFMPDVSPFGPKLGPVPKRQVGKTVRYTTYHCGFCGLLYAFPPPPEASEKAGNEQAAKNPAVSDKQCAICGGEKPCLNHYVQPPVPSEMIGYRIEED